MPRVPKLFASETKPGLCRSTPIIRPP
jgi:hypothetical protein